MKAILQFVLLPCLVVVTHAYAAPPPLKVIVTGAAGRTGQLVFKKLHENQAFDVVGVVRTEKSAKKLMRKVNCGLGQVIVADVTSELNVEDDNYIRGLEEADAMIICTSAVPQIIKRSLFKTLINKLFRRQVKPPLFRFRPGQHPEKVDYEGQKAQINLAKNIGVKRIVLVSSMGGTDPTNFLNQIGKDENGEGDGDILIWKRRAEKYLLQSGLSYTIIHPGGLKDTPGGQKRLVLDVDDVLLKNKERQISRADVAELCVASLTVSAQKNVAFDCISVTPESDEEIVSAEDALVAFLTLGKTCDYSD